MNYTLKKKKFKSSGCKAPPGFKTALIGNRQMLVYTESDIGFIQTQLY